MKPTQDTTMTTSDSISWLTGNIATFAILFMSNEVITLIGHFVSWVGILALAIFNLVKAYSIWKSTQNISDDGAGSTKD